MPFQKRPAGNKLWVWSEGGAVPAEYTRDCVITCHGAQVDGYKTFLVPARTSLNYVGPEGYMLKSDIFPMVRGKVAPYEIIAGGKESRDYSLSKFQGAKHGGKGETYGYISNDMHPEAMGAQMKSAGWSDDQIAKATMDKIVMDVVTVRNRKMYSDPTLSEAIKALETAGYKYKTIWCSFCRYAMHAPSAMNSVITYSAKMA